ncbi:MAG TPA: chromate transporter [Ktedonosporobacter sp.]|nr:chromate transporter [Ktedonosporobacter sp.]
MIDPLLYFLLFLKASLFSTGGFANLPSLEQDLPERGWATQLNFQQAIVIGQLSPGPNGLWVVSLGYLTYGYLGALLALIAVTLPPLLVLAVEAGYNSIERQRWVKGMMRGISLAVVGISLTVAWSIISPSVIDWRSWLIAAAACALALTRRVPLLLILTLAGIAGYLLYR